MNDQQQPLTPPMLTGFNLPEVATHKIVQMTRKESGGSKSPSWVCNCTNGDVIWVFKHAIAERNTHPLFAAYHAEMDAMKLHETIFWNDHPIQVCARKDGDYWRTTAVLPRAEGAVPNLSPMPESAFAQDLEEQEASKTVKAKLAWEWARAAAANLCTMTHVNPLILDVETDSKHPGSATILSIAVIDMEEGDVLYRRFVRPVKPNFKNDAQEINGITPSMWQDAPTLADQHADLSALLNNRLVITYNTEYDITVLTNNCYRAGLPPVSLLADVCAMKLFSAYRGAVHRKTGEWEFTSLSAAAAMIGIAHPDAHDALADCRTTREILKLMAIGTPLQAEFPF